MSVCPLWSYTENFMMIQQDLAEICEFQSKCLTGSSSSGSGRERERDKVDYNVCPCHCDGVVMR